MDYRKATDELAKILRKFYRSHEDSFEEAVRALTSCVKNGNKIFVFGNGGSAAEAQHFAAEMVNRFLKDRRSIPAIALSADAACLTAIGNDRSFDAVFARQIEALGRTGDAVLALTTSGTSANIIKGLQAAKTQGMTTIALTGEKSLEGTADYLLDVPSRSTPRIQEAHLVLLHLMAEEIEKNL